MGPARPWVSPLQTSLWKCPRGGSGFEPRPYLHFREEAGAAPGAAAGWGCGAVAPASTWRSLSFPEDHVSTRLPWGRDPALKSRVPPWSLLGGLRWPSSPAPSPVWEGTVTRAQLTVHRRAPRTPSRGSPHCIHQAQGGFGGWGPGPGPPPCPLPPECRPCRFPGPSAVGLVVRAELAWSVSHKESGGAARGFPVGTF